MLCLFVFTQIPLTSAVHLNAPGTLIVSVESPLTSKDYSPGEIVPVIVVISDRQGIPMTNASVLVTSSYNMQFVHVPFLKITQMNQTQVAVYGPTSSAPNQTQPTQVGLVVLNDAGFVQLPYSTGNWSLELQIEPLTGAYIPYYADITVHVTVASPVATSSLYLIAAGWVVTIAFVAFVIRKRIRSRRALLLKQSD